MPRFRTTCLALCFALLGGGCSSVATIERCMNENWYALGYQDAQAGHGTQQLIAHQNTCTQHGISPHHSRYLDGWMAGRGLTTANPT